MPHGLPTCPRAPSAPPRAGRAATLAGRAPTTSLLHTILNKRRLACWMMLMAGTTPVFATQTHGESILPNGDFRAGLQHWYVVGDPNGRVNVLDVEPARGLPVVELDARRIRYGDVSLVSHRFPVQPGTAYRLSGWTRRLQGTGYRGMLGAVWLDAEGRPLGYAESWGLTLYGEDWQQHEQVVVAPADAAIAHVKVGLEMGGWSRNRALFADLRLQPAAEPFARLHLDLLVRREGGRTTVTARVANAGSWRPDTITLELEPPAGLTLTGAARVAIEPPGAHESGRQAFTLTGSAAAGTRIDAVLNAVRGDERREIRGHAFLPPAAPSERVPAHRPPDPQVPRDPRLKLGCYYFPTMMDWGDEGRGLRAVGDRMPLLGYYNETAPAVADWHLYWLLSHGIRWLAVDWYWNQGHAPFNEALDQGLMHSRFFEKMEFCLLWVPQYHVATDFKPYDFSANTLTELADLLCARYFSRTNHLCIDGKPVLMVFLPAKLVNANGGPAGARAVLRAMRDRVRQHGHTGLYLVAVHDRPLMPDFAAAGFDAVAPYNYMFADAQPGPDNTVPFDELLPRYGAFMGEARANAHGQGLPYIPTAWTGWNDAPRRYPQIDVARTVGGDAPAFAAMLNLLEGRIEPEPPPALIEAWNEWGEGSTFEPGTPYGFERLQAIRTFVAPDAPALERVAVPDAAAVAELQAPPGTAAAAREAELRRHAHALDLHEGFDIDFDSHRGLWLRCGYGCAGVHLAEGRLEIWPMLSAFELVGPPMMDLDADVVRGVIAEMHLPEGTEAWFDWMTEASPRRDATHRARFESSAADPGTYRIELAGHPEWRGRIQQFFITITGCNGKTIYLERLATQPEPIRSEKGARP